jgi:hypothetical protein
MDSLEEQTSFAQDSITATFTVVGMALSTAPPLVMERKPRAWRLLPALSWWRENWHRPLRKDVGCFITVWCIERQRSRQYTNLNLNLL